VEPKEFRIGEFFDVRLHLGMSLRTQRCCFVNSSPLVSFLHAQRHGAA
jgi:hypothetical protein